MCTECIRNGLCTECLQSVYGVSTKCVQSVYKVCTECAQSVYRVCTECVRRTLDLSESILVFDARIICCLCVSCEIDRRIDDLI